METQVVTAWGINNFDRINLKSGHYIVLSKNLDPLGGEIGFCFNFMEQGRKGRNWRVFRWNEQITRIN